MKKLAFIVEKFVEIPVGGEPAIHINLINYLLSLGFQIDVYYERNAKPLAITPPYKKFENFSKNKEKYIEFINNNNYDLVISSRYGLKYPELNADIYTIHSHSDLFSQKTKFGFLYNILKPRKKRIKAEENILKKNSNKLFIFCSTQLKDDYNSICKLENSNVINPYANFFCNTQSKKRKDVFTFGISALGFQNKGGYLFLKSAFLLKLLNKNFKLKIIYKEKPGFLPKLLLLITGLTDRTEFFDRQTDMRPYFESIDCLVMASQLESFGMTALEAMTYNLPVIVSSNCGVKELINDGENGFIFSFKGFKEINLMKKMKYVIEHQDKYYSSNFTWCKEKYNKEFTQYIEKELQNEKT